MQWITYVWLGTYYVALVDENSLVLRTHPIGFADPREARRAAERLNARDQKEAS